MFCCGGGVGAAKIQHRLRASRRCLLYTCSARLLGRVRFMGFVLAACKTLAFFRDGSRARERSRTPAPTTTWYPPVLPLALEPERIEVRAKRRRRSAKKNSPRWRRNILSRDSQRARRIAR